ncbi:MAG: MFS transporter [Candidatus Omnitrophica bacterium CG12_big_fil_rev_8_21_14_0_65_45_16]|nr:MAG: MFS transporter [Candidatus Omnitrophica bacterium CG12_big_fil_rev_8_21_14_0_65_45_16]
MPKSKLPQSIFILGLVSFFTDVSSDMIYPLLPIFLVSYLGASMAFMGIIEGIAESTAAFFMLFSGVWADRAKDRSKLVLAGYSVSSFFRPLAAVAWHPVCILFTRFFDRVGKGIRTSPRDALIADSTDPHQRGAAFGLQRSLDHAGAVFGPLTAGLLMYLGVTNLRVVFALAAVPALVSVVLIAWKIREVRAYPLPQAQERGFKLSPPKGRLKVYLIILFVFILSCSSDAFLLLKASESGVKPSMLPFLWMTFSAVKALSVFPLGKLSDKLGRRHMLLAGWTLYTIVYMGFGLASTAWQVSLLFVCYGLFYGFTEGTERALLSEYALTYERGQAFGWYYFVVGMGALPASLIFGFIWQHHGSKTAFLVSAAISACAAFGLFVFLKLAPSAKIPVPSPAPKPTDL